MYTLPTGIEEQWRTGMQQGYIYNNPLISSKSPQIRCPPNLSSRLPYANDQSLWSALEACENAGRLPSLKDSKPRQ